MATALSAPVVVLVSKLAKAECTHQQFHVHASNGDAPPMITNTFLGVEDATTNGFTKVEGIRADTGKHSTESVSWTQDAYNAFAAMPDVQVALGYAKQYHDYAISGFDQAHKPAWLP